MPARTTKREPVRARLMNQKQIEQEYGVPTRDVLRAVQAGRFPAPVRVIGKVRWFNRREIARFFKDQGDDGEA